jgi:hypothetical protein
MVALILLISPFSHSPSLVSRSYGMMETLPSFDAEALRKTEPDVIFKVTWNPMSNVNFREVPSLFDDQDDLFLEDGFELPTTLGEAVIRTLAEINLDQTVRERYILIGFILFDPRLHFHVFLSGLRLLASNAFPFLLILSRKPISMY